MHEIDPWSGFHAYFLQISNESNFSRSPSSNSKSSRMFSSMWAAKRRWQKCWKSKTFYVELARSLNQRRALQTPTPPKNWKWLQTTIKSPSLSRARKRLQQWKQMLSHISETTVLAYARLKSQFIILLKFYKLCLLNHRANASSCNYSTRKCFKNC
jgi:hypothetical protein